METALYGLNLDPLIIASESEAGGSEPFHQISRPVVFKLHGDYKQPDSMLATDIELRTYRHGIRRLLARALEDYGLIVAGWSGEYDLALRRAIQAVRSRRYPLWYVYRESLSDTIRQVRNLRDAQTIQTTDADSFFSDLLQKVTAIDDYSAPHPREVEALSAELTLLLRTAAGPIAVNSLLSNEIERCFSAVTDRYRFPYTREAESSEEASSEAFDQLAIRVGRDYIGTSTSAATLMAIGCAWSSADYHEIWKRGIERLGNLPVVQERSTIVFLRELRNLPWLLLLYSSCIASIWRGNLSVVRVMTRETSVHGDFSRRRVPLIAKERVAFICCQNASQKELTSSLARAVREREADRGGTFWTPMSELLFAAARGPVSDMIPGDEDYEECFDRTELVLNLVAADLQLRQDSDDSELPSGTRAPGPWPGRYSWRTTERGLWFIEEAENEMGGSSPFWRSVDAELFRNDGDRRNAALDCIKARLPDWTRYGFGNF